MSVHLRKPTAMCACSHMHKEHVIIHKNKPKSGKCCMPEISKGRLLHYLSVLCRMMNASICVSLPSAAEKLHFSACSFTLITSHAAGAALPGQM